jgi:hypothetical protein
MKMTRKFILFFEWFLQKKIELTQIKKKENYLQKSYEIKPQKAKVPIKNKINEFCKKSFVNKPFRLVFVYLFTSS